MTDADVYIAKMPRDDVPRDFYTRCGYEMAGTNFMVKDRKTSMKSRKRGSLPLDKAVAITHELCGTLTG